MMLCPGIEVFTLRCCAQVGFVHVQDMPLLNVLEKLSLGHKYILWKVDNNIGRTSSVPSSFCPTLLLLHGSARVLFVAMIHTRWRCFLVIIQWFTQLQMLYMSCFQGEFGTCQSLTACFESRIPPRPPASCTMEPPVGAQDNTSMQSLTSVTQRLLML